MFVYKRMKAMSKRRLSKCYVHTGVYNRKNDELGMMLYNKHKQSYSNLIQHDKLTLSKKRLNRTALLVPAARWRACVQS